MTHEAGFDGLRNTSVEETLAYYRSLGATFDNPPQITLKLMSQTLPGEDPVGARDVVISTAVQCYAPGVAKLSVREGEKMHNIADSTLEAGHHTTRMHMNYTWQLVGVSRSFTREVAHANPYYNTEQQSQRYVEAKEGNYLVPSDLDPAQREVFLATASMANAFYFELLPALAPVIEQRMREMYPKSGWNSLSTADRLNKKRDKIAQEVARYVLPIAQKTNYFHTLNELQLLRLFRASQMDQVSDEARFVIGQMVETVLGVDGTFMSELRAPLTSDDTIIARDEYFQGNTSEFDALLDGSSSVLLDYPTHVTTTVPFSVRNVLGASRESLSDEDAWRLVLDPAQNPYLSDTYDVGIMDPVTQSLRQAQFVWATKLSHAADSQRQRHRRTPGAPPPLRSLYTGQPDYIKPLIVRENAQLNESYDQMMERIYSGVSHLLDMGTPADSALSLLPNAHAVRVVESGDLLDWHHRLKQRLCYLAQEEIFFISVDQASDIVKRIPAADHSFLAPCGIRQHAGVKPRCPEGDRFCGVPVFHMQIDEYRAKRLI